jgi:LPS O-antigen subunit length determinant protein (WzzB/FepE family)
MDKVQDDEIDLFELFQKLWDGKLLISAFVAIAVLLGGAFLWFKDAVYESTLVYSIHTIPPFYEANKASTDFQNKFYSVSVFEEWKQNNSNTSLVFEDFSETKVVDGFILSKDEDDRLATLTSEKKVGYVVLVKSNQLPILDDFFKFATHINAALKKEYIQRAEQELNIIETRYKDFSNANDAIISNILSIDRYIVSAKNGSSVLAIQRPTMPKKVSPKSSLILAMSVVLGGMVGVMYVLISNAVRKRKESSAKA